MSWLIRAIPAVVLLIWVAWGVWRAAHWQTHIGTAFCVVAVACLLWAAFQDSHPIGWLYPTPGQVVAEYGTRPETILLLIATYGMALTCLIAAELRHRHVTSAT
jgi:hypothetical protein